MMISSTTVAIIAFATFVVLLLLDIPVCISMMCCGVFFSMLVMRPGAALTLLSDSFYSTFTDYNVAVMPMFMFMGGLAAESRLGDDLFDCFAAYVGHRRGGLATATMIACAAFGAICGVASATAALMTRVAYPQMKKYSYSDTISCGSICAGASLSILIPPSMTLITYGIVAGASISKLLMGGILTGIVLLIVFVVSIKIWTRINPNAAPTSRKFSAKERFKALRSGGIIEILLVFALSMGGMFAGWFTPTEAGVVGVAGMFIVSILFKRFSWKVLKKALVDTLIMSGMIFFMMVGAGTLGKLFTVSGLPDAIGKLAISVHLSNFGIIMFVTLIYLILGCFIDAVPLTLLMTPIFLPVIKLAGYDAVWFGCYVVVVISLGAITPPVGMSCFTCAAIVQDVPVTTVFKGSVPYVASFVVMCALLALIPGIATWLPSLLIG